jgi:1-acyl-sn-glycerol-3-phosphate acyltransferase
MTLQTVIFFVLVLPYTFIMSVFSSLGAIIDRSGNLYLHFARAWSRGCLWLLGIKVEIEGQENYNPGKVYVVASNHASMADIPIILAFIKLNLRMIAKAELGNIQFFGWSLKLGDFILIDRKSRKKALSAIEEAKKRIHAGKSVHVFADGTRDKEGKIQSLKQGAFVIACQTRIPILPVTILGSHHLAEKNSLIIHKGTVKLIIDCPIIPTGAEKSDINRLKETTYQTLLKRYNQHIN